jgi:hypothetical protein
MDFEKGGCRTTSPAPIARVVPDQHSSCVKGGIWCSKDLPIARLEQLHDKNEGVVQGLMEQISDLEAKISSSSNVAIPKDAGC